MKKSTRALVGLIVLETLLLGGAAWMVLQVRWGVWDAPDPAKSISAITQTAGAAMGFIAVLLLLAFFHHRRKGH